MAIIKKYNELTNDEILDIFKARVMVFVVEQKCPYQEVDEIDRTCYHAYIKDNNEIVAYSRIIFKDDYAVIGRVITTKRGKGFGLKILNDTIDFIKLNNYNRIEIEAQEYAIGFYSKVGFNPYGKRFLMDDIWHVKMNLKI